MAQPGRSWSAAIGTATVNRRAGRSESERGAIATGKKAPRQQSLTRRHIRNTAVVLLMRSSQALCGVIVFGKQGDDLPLCRNCERIAKARKEMSMIQEGSS